MDKSDTNLSCYILQCLSLSETHVNHTILDYILLRIKACDIYGYVRIIYIYIYIYIMVPIKSFFKDWKAFIFLAMPGNSM